MTMKDRWNALNQRKVWYGIGGALIVALLMTLVIGKCSAADFKWGGEPYLFFGLEEDVTGELGVCYPDAANPISANIGAGVPVIQAKAWEFNAQWTHHSCAFDDDNDVYDGLGVQLRWYPRKLFD